MDNDPPSQVNESSRPPAATTLREGLLRISCGYDLRGSPPGGRCPECGTKSPARNLLNLARFGGEAWLQNASRRIRFWSVASVAIPPTIIVAGVPVLYPPGPTASWYVRTALALIIVWVSMSALAVGVWALTARHPAIDRDEPPINSRRLTRASLLTGIAALLIALTCPENILWTRWWGLCCVVMALPMGPAGVVGVLGLTYRVADLYQVVGARRTRLFSALVGELYVAVCLLNAVIVVASGAIWMGNVFAAAGLEFLIGGLGLLSLCTPCLLKNHLWVACAELAKQQNAVTMPRAAEETDEVPSSTQ